MAAASLNRALEPDEIVCPAGRLVGAASCACAIEDTMIDGRHNPESIEAFCAGDYKACPSWQLEKARLAEHKHAGTYVEDARKRGEKAKARKEAHRQQRYARAYELLFGDSEEARRFRARSGIAKKLGPRGMAEIADRARAA
jgi:hypothetical protein